MILELLQYDFFRRAILAGGFLAWAASILGIFLILRKDAMMGHGLTHIAFAGVALALFLNILPFPVALIFSTIAAFIILKVREKVGLYGDTAVAIISNLGLAAGICLATLGKNFNVSLLSYLFGNILAVSLFELYLSLALAGVVIACLILFYHELLYVTFDEESAKASGLPVAKLDILLAMLTAVTVVIGMKIMGLLLVSALLAIPSAAALQVARNFHSCVILASFLGIISAVLGILLAGVFNLPASGTIVLLSGVFFLVCFLWKIIRGE
ncbi:ABC-3 protein [Thermodesulfatator indicus DSM 15286]|uniref:ABC-3 protein n=1 Tax=Thermodesulfatator indicus (strain DSM 15286 / JCM 11887 / CIR29812) TaxID=667014 RepID=F8AC83_THEID|nr:metal ABC transporter permease [Thermodesulfatator indicus]AEH45718.1 ABC-3 protein [Thermodesulfatator indicus DSM 15286]